MPEPKLQFASDNTAGICPEAWAAMHEANGDFVPSYGDDRYTLEASNLFRELFETDCDVYFVFNGTAANSLALASLCQSYHSVICHDSAHVETDECGAPEFFSNGTKLLTASGAHGKLDLIEAERIVTQRNDVHYPKPRVISLTQATESGTVYRADEIRAFAQLAEKYRMHVHMDGARFANAVASLAVHPSEITWRAGVDVLCFGGTKNGLPVGEAVVFFRKDLAEDFQYRVKQAGQLASKMRYVSAPWLGLLDGDVWLKNARHANAMARRLHDKIRQLPGIKIMFPVEANAVFAQVPAAVQKGLRDKGWRFYTFIGAGGCRLMCAWDTAPETVDRFAADMSQLSHA